MNRRLHCWGNEHSPDHHFNFYLMHVERSSRLFQEIWRYSSTLVSCDESIVSPRNSLSSLQQFSQHWSSDLHLLVSLENSILHFHSILWIQVSRSQRNPNWNSFLEVSADCMISPHSTLMEDLIDSLQIQSPYYFRFCKQSFIFSWFFLLYHLYDMIWEKLNELNFWVYDFNDSEWYASVWLITSQSSNPLIVIYNLIFYPLPLPQVTSQSWCLPQASPKSIQSPTRSSLLQNQILLDLRSWWLTSEMWGNRVQLLDQNMNRPVDRRRMSLISFQLQSESGEEDQRHRPSYDETFHDKMNLMKTQIRMRNFWDDSTHELSLSFARTGKMEVKCTYGEMFSFKETDFFVSWIFVLTPFLHNTLYLHTLVMFSTMRFWAFRISRNSSFSLVVIWHHPSKYIFYDLVPLPFQYSIWNVSFRFLLKTKIKSTPPSIMTTQFCSSSQFKETGSLRNTILLMRTYATLTDP